MASKQKQQIQIALCACSLDYFQSKGRNGDAAVKACSKTKLSLKNRAQQKIKINSQENRIQELENKVLLQEILINQLISRIEGLENS